MRSRAALLTLSLLATLAGCSRSSEAPAPKVVAEPRRDASVEASAPDAGALAKAAPPAWSPTPFTIVARAPTSNLAHARTIASAPTLVQRLAGGGLVVASQYARARANGPGALAVELIGAGQENQVLDRPSMVQGMEDLRWVWSDAALSVAVFEEETARTGPRLTSYKIGANGFQVLRPSVGYWSAALRDGSVLALERTAYEVPNSSMYPKGSGHEQNAWTLKPARIAVLSGRAAAPLLPAGVCPTSMSAAPDGTLIVTVEKCDESGEEWAVGAVRYAPSATQGKLEWFTPHSSGRSPLGGNPDDVTTFAASANEIYIADGDRLRTWNGKEWATSVPFPDEKLASVSRAPSGELWAITNGRVVKRTGDGATWSVVTLPTAPADPIDDPAYVPPTYQSSNFVKVTALPDEFSLRERGSYVGVLAMSVDATAEEVLVLAAIQQEALVLSTKPREPVARLPSLGTQRARIAQTLKRRVATGPKDCTSRSFLVFPETTTLDALRAAFGDGGAAAAAAVDAGDPAERITKIGEGIVEGQKRFFVYGEPAGIAAAAQRLVKLSPKRLCGPAVVDREL